MQTKYLSYVSLIASLLMWPLALIGIGGVLGDPAPTMSKSDLYWHKQLMPGLLLSGAVIAFVTAAWLSGYCFQSSRWQSIDSGISVVLFVLMLIISFNGFM